MAPIRKRRFGSPVRRLDVAAWRELLADGKLHVSIATVVQEGAAHFEIVSEGGLLVDVLVDLELQPTGVRCTGRMGVPGVLWAIPPVGAEVLVCIPDGEIEWGPIVVCNLSANQVPDGLAATTFVLAVPPGGQLLVHDGAAGEAGRLPTRDEFLNHGHPSFGAPPAAIVTPTPAAPDGGSFPGTQTLKAK